jgi:hypothetical protein
MPDESVRTGHLLLGGEKQMTVEDIQRFMREHPNESLPLGHGWIHPQAALDLLKEGPLEVIDILKKTESITFYQEGRNG